jgi:hypothetical protein
MFDMLSPGARGPAARSRLERLTSVDHPDRSSAFPTPPRAPAFLSVEAGDALPLVAYDELGQPLARFAHPAALAWFLAVSGTGSGAPTLPFTIARQARRAAGDQLALEIEDARP